MRTEHHPTRTVLPLLVLALALPLVASAHSPICFCFENEDDSDRITCEGGFSDGASAEGVSIRVLDDRDRVLIDGKMNDKSEFDFARPSNDFHIVFDAGDEHTVTIFEDEIE